MLLTQFEVQAIIKSLKEGGVVAFPTETVYGLGADISNEMAIQKIYSLKGRDFQKPLSIFVSSLEMLEEYVCEITPEAERLVKKYWPGPLTLIFKANQNVSKTVCAGGDTVGVRMSSHPIVAHILREFEKPITATSANVSGLPSAQSYEQVLHYFSTKIDYVVESKWEGATLESTVVDVTGLECRILREGELTRQEIMKQDYART